MNDKSRRKWTSWFRNHPLQTRYLTLVTVAMVVPAAVVGLCLYSLVISLLARQMAFPEAIQANLVPVIERVNFILLVTLPPLFIAVFAVALAISHRFAGPIERLESELDHVAQGNLNHRIRLREHDYLSGVALRVNLILETIKKRP